MRDITLADTFYHLFTTRAFATGIPTVLSGTPVVSAYENDSLTQITAGITLGADHDSVAGLNLLTVVATGANGYEAGKDYSLVITTGTVGGVSVVGEVVGQFSIGRSAAAVDLANGTDGLGAIKTDTAAILVDTGTTLDGKIDTIDGIVDSILVDTAEIGAAGAGLTALATQASVNTVDGIVDAILLDTAEIGAAGAGLTALATAANLATVDTVVDGIQTDLDNGTDGLGALKTLIDALNDITAASVMTTQMTEAYAALGVAPTPAQLLFEVRAMLLEFAIAGTTLTAKKLDGSTTALTATLDDATSPTSLTRAT